MTLSCLRILRVHDVICLLGFSKTFKHLFTSYIHNITSSRPYAPDILQNLFLFWVLIKVSHLLCCLGHGLQPVPTMKYAVLRNHRGLKSGKCKMKYSLLQQEYPDMPKITISLKTTCHSHEWSWHLSSIFWSMYILSRLPKYFSFLPYPVYSTCVITIMFFRRKTRKRERLEGYLEDRVLPIFYEILVSLP